MRQELCCWLQIQGRGEVVRLALTRPPPRALLAPPLPRAGRVVVGQGASILLYPGPRLGLAQAGRRHARGRTGYSAPSRISWTGCTTPTT